jgi:hypothetical protein
MVAQGEKQSFVSLGVALDWSIRDGLEFLGEFGPFDEVMVGRSWLNSGGVRYMWRDIPGEPVCPSIIGTTRQVDVTQTAITVSEEELLLRKVGLTEIEQWGDLGFPLPGAVVAGGDGHGADR